MRILVLTQYFFPHAGGSQEYILELYQKLISQNKDIQVDLICYNTDNALAHEIIGNLHVYRLPCFEFLPGQFALANPFSLIKLLITLKQRHGNYDFVNSHTRFFDNSWWGPIAAKYLGAKSILTDHCASHPVHNNIFVSSAISVFDTALAWIIPKLYDQVTTISVATAQFLHSYGNTFEIPVFYSGVHQAFEKKSAAYKLPFKKTATTKVVAFVGRMIASKNPRLALTVAQAIIKENAHVQFVFAGSGPELEKLSKASNKQIHFVGKLNRQQLAGLLKQTDILIHPSKHHEGLPITLLEAGATKTAVIATNAGGTKEVIINNDTGIISEANARDLTIKLKILLDRPRIARKLAQNLLKKVTKDFSWKKTARSYMSFLNSINR